MTAAIDLESQLDDLRRSLETLQAAVNSQPRVSLTAVESTRYLGQAVDLIVRALNRQNSTPVQGAAVTLVTSWGVLRGGDDQMEGTSIAGTTAADGTVRFTLRPNASLDDNEDQDALEAMLASLDPAAATPGDVAAGLQALAQQYRWEANRGYRNAVDAYFRTFGQKVLHSPAERDYMTEWNQIPATVIAHLGETATNRAAAATVTLLFRDWLGPWYQVYSQYAQTRIQLAPDLTQIKQQANSAAGLVAGVFGRVSILVDSEFGDIGKKVAQQVGQKAIGTFLDTGIADLPVATRLVVGPALDTGSRVLTAAGASALTTTLSQTHAAVVVAETASNKVDKADMDAALAVKANASDLQAVQTAVATKADQAAFQTFQTQTDKTLQVKANASDLVAIQTAVATKADQAAFQTFQTQTDKALQVKANTSDLQAIQTAVATKADQAAFQTFQTQTNKTLDVKANTSDLQAAIQTAVATKADQAAFQTFQTQTNKTLEVKANTSDLVGIQSAIASKAAQGDLMVLQTQITSIFSVKADQSAFQSFQSQVNGALQAKANTSDLQVIQGAIVTKADQSVLASFRAQATATFATKVDQTAFQSFQTQTDKTLQMKANTSDLQAIQTAVATKADLSAFQAFQTQTGKTLEVKANTSDLQAIQTVVATKADQAVFQTFQTQVNAALKLKANAADLQVVQTAVAAKADQAALQTLRTDLTKTLDSKAGFSDLLTGLQSVQGPLASTSSELTAFVRLTNTALTNKADTTALAAIQARVGVLEGKAK